MRISKDITENSKGHNENFKSYNRIVDGLPDYHRAECSVIAGKDSEAIPHDQAVEDGFAECEVCTPEAASAPKTADTRAPETSAAPAEPEPVAESEPAATPEPEPAAATAGTGTTTTDTTIDTTTSTHTTDDTTATDTAPPPAAAAGSGVTAGREVWVIDGRPRFHTQDCLIIKGQPATKLPLDEATADGFKACSLCRAG